MEKSKEKHLTGFWKRALGLLEIAIAVLMIVGMVEQWSFSEWVWIDILLIVSGILFSVVHYNLILGGLSALIVLGLLFHATYPFWLFVDVVAIILYAASGPCALAGWCLTGLIVAPLIKEERPAPAVRITEEHVDKEATPSTTPQVRAQIQPPVRPEPPSDTFPEERGVDDSSIWGT